MNRVRRLIIWFWRAWPVIVLAGLLGTHVFLIQHFSTCKSDINKTISLFTQIVGGLIILYSIDSNIGIIKKINLLGVFVRYLKEFPLFTKNVTLNIQGAVHSTFGCHAALTVARNPKTIEEKIEYLQEQITEVKNELISQTKTLDEKIDKETKGLKKQIQKAQSELGQVKRQIEDVSIGGIKIQFFGVLLMVYGSISGYFS